MLCDCIADTTTWYRPQYPEDGYIYWVEVVGDILLFCKLGVTVIELIPS